MRTASVPIYCTMATTTRYCFPFAPNYVPDVWIPTYMPLNNCENVHEVQNLLIQTAALPDIFSMQTIRGRRFVDGGVADNTPIFPTLAHAPRTIVIIYLKHTVPCGSILRQQEAKRVAEVSERLRCAQLSTLEQTIEKKRKAHVAETICRSGIPEQEATAKFVDLWSGRRHWWFPTIFQENSRATINPRVHFLSQTELSALSEREQKKENHCCPAIN